MSGHRLILNVAKKSPLWFGLCIVLGLSGAIFNGIGITLIIPLMLDLLGQDILENANFPPLLRSLFSPFDGVPDDYRPLALMGVLLVALLLKNLANYGGTAMSSLLSRDYVCTLRREGLRLLLDVDLDYYASVRLGDLMNYLNTEVNRVATAVRTLARIVTLLVTILVFLVILMAISWPLTLVSALLMATVALVNQVSIHNAKAFGQELSSASAALSNRLIEVMSGIRLVKTTANEDREYALINDLVTQREQAEFKSQLVFASIGPVNEMLSIMAFIALIIVGRSLLASQIETFSSIILIYLVVLFRLLPVIGQLNSSRSQ
ncbi:MAG: ABC transporter ATP-binding protein, partial [Nodosilinea sp.]